MPCSHCGGKTNICPYCKYSQDEEFVKCPECGEIADFCEHCGCSLNVKLPNNDNGLDETFTMLFGYVNKNVDNRNCPYCLESIGNVDFCPFCGHDLAGIEQETVVDSNRNQTDEYLNSQQYPCDKDIISEFFTNPLKVIFQSIFWEYEKEPENNINKQKEEIATDYIKEMQEEKPKRDFDKLDNKSSSIMFWIYLLLVIIALLIIYQTLFGI